MKRLRDGDPVLWVTTGCCLARIKIIGLVRKLVIPILNLGKLVQTWFLRALLQTWFAKQQIGTQI